MNQFIVTGGRDFDNWDMVCDVLSYLEPDLIIQGGATGADALARRWADENEVPCITIPAHWHRYGRAAGPMRNAIMLDTYPNAAIVAFPGGRGTANCVAFAEKRNRKVIKIEGVINEDV